MTAAATAAALARVLARTVGPGEVEGLRRLTGGATKTTWSFDWVGPHGARPLILQQTAPVAPELVGSGKRVPKLGAEEDAAIMTVAREGGVPAPEVVHLLAPGDGLGGGYITARVEGETLGRRIVADPGFADARGTMARQCGEILAAIHRLPVAKLPFLAPLSAAGELALYGGMLAQYDLVHPVLSYALRWVGERLPAQDRVAVVHSDFRTGNLIVDPATGIRCVLDWEIARLGDPMQDLGVLCLRTWRFGGAGECGGFGSREDLYAAYEAASGERIDPRRVRFWEAFSNVKWAIACVRRGLAQGADGRAASVELAAVGRRLEEPLWDFLNLATAKD